MSVDYDAAADAIEGLRAEIPVRLSELRLSQGDLARITGLSPSTVTRFKQGHEVSVPAAVSLLRWLAGVERRAALPDPTDLADVRDRADREATS